MSIEKHPKFPAWYVLRSKGVMVARSQDLVELLEISQFIMENK